MEAKATRSPIASGRRRRAFASGRRRSPRPDLGDGVALVSGRRRSPRSGRPEGRGGGWMGGGAVGFVVGVFNFTNGAHDVVEVTRAEFDSCNVSTTTTNPITTSPARITLTSAGEHYYICTFTQHCNFGQKLAINVTAAGSTATPPSGSAPAPAPSSPATPPPASSPTPPPRSSGPAPATPSTPSTQPPVTAPPPPSNSAPSFTAAALPFTFLAAAVAFLYN
ncbi:UNVERIFIED_CONTAM: Uclacyanin 1 [Sesamum calycinum]|uniref:Uclacyanin 1 n=1 Tax=Sesamum calycinum TaxID=2727403 RepID=A0AAW2RS68_9LAMI